MKKNSISLPPSLPTTRAPSLPPFHTVLLTFRIMEEGEYIAENVSFAQSSLYISKWPSARGLMT